MNVSLQLISHIKAVFVLKNVVMGYLLVLFLISAEITLGTGMPVLRQVTKKHLSVVAGLLYIQTAKTVS